MSLAACALVATTLASAPAHNPNPWELAEDDDNIKVWARDVPGGSVREVKAEAIIEAPSAKVWEVIRDTDKFIEFMPYVETIRRLKSESESIHYYYQLVDPPLVSSRDYVVRITLEPYPDTGVFIRRWQAVDGVGPAPNDDAVRLELNEGSFTLEPIGKAKTMLHYRVLTDPGGAIPKWIVNRANTSSVPNLVEAIRNRTRDPNWRR